MKIYIIEYRSPKTWARQGEAIAQRAGLMHICRERSVKQSVRRGGGGVLMITHATAIDHRPHVPTMPARSEMAFFRRSDCVLARVMQPASQTKPICHRFIGHPGSHMTGDKWRVREGGRGDVCPEPPSTNRNWESVPFVSPASSARKTSAMRKTLGYTRGTTVGQAHNLLPHPLLSIFGI